MTQLFCWTVFVLQRGTVGEHTQVQGSLAGGPADTTQTLVVAGYLIVVLP